MRLINWSINNKFQLNPGKCEELRIKFTNDPCRDKPVEVKTIMTLKLLHRKNFGIAY